MSIKRMYYFIFLLLLIIDPSHAQKSSIFENSGLRKNNFNGTKSYYSEEKNGLSPDARQYLEMKGFDINGSLNETLLPNDDAVSAKNEFAKISVGFDLKRSGYQPQVYSPFDKRILNDSHTDTILTDDFEGNFPDTKWQLSGNPSWGKTDYLKRNGKYSAWCALGGINGVQPGQGYPNNCQSMMVFGPFDLSEVNYAELNFNYWLDTEYQKDWFFFMASTDGNNFNGIGMSGESTWEEDFLPLSNVTGLGNLTGYSQVWIAFLFESDQNTTQDKGVFIDDVVLYKKQVNGKPIAGYISGVWNSSYNPYVAVNEVIVPGTDTLFLEPGVEILFETYNYFSIYGSLIAIGTDSDSILFKSNKLNPSSEDWRGIAFYSNGTDSSRLDHCSIRNARVGIGCYWASPKIKNNSIYDCVQGIKCEASKSLIEENKIYATRKTYEISAVHLKDSFVIFKNNRVSGSYFGIHTVGYLEQSIIYENNINNNITGIRAGGFSGRIIDNKAENNSQYGITVGIVSDYIINRNAVINNGSDGIQAGTNTSIMGNLVKGNGGIGIAGGEVLYNNVIVNNLKGGISSKKRVSNNIVAWNQGFGIQINDWADLIYYNNVYENLENYSGMGFQSAFGEKIKVNTVGDSCDMYFNISKDPMFLSPQINDYHLQNNSPCIDAGNPSTFFNDYDGTVNDMGMYGGSNLYIDYYQYNFGFVPFVPTLEKNKKKQINLFNNRDGELIIEDIQLSDKTNFSIDADVPFSVTRNFLPIYFHPKSSGNFICNLSLISNQFFGSDTCQIVLKGIGVNASVVSGSVSGNWTRSASPYFIERSSVYIDHGSTLTIEPGVAIYFDGLDSEFNIYGKLLAIGSKADSILFTSPSLDASWGGIRFVYADSTSVLKYCKVEFSNKCGIYCENSSITIRNSRISKNGLGGDISGGGLNTDNCSPNVINNQFDNNRAKHGGAIWIGTGSPLIANNIISNNRAGTWGGGIYCYGGAKILNNVIRNNFSGFSGGIHLPLEGSSLINNIIVFNKAISKGGGLYIVGGEGQEGTAQNNIVWYNYAPENSQVYQDVQSTTSRLEYSCIQNGLEGRGNIQEDPCFINASQGDFRLQSNSPCIDAGNPGLQYNDPEDPNNLGFALYPALGTLRNDIGAFGGRYATSWEIITSIHEEFKSPSTLPTTFKLFNNFPNPFNSTTTIKYQLPKTTNVTLSIYNILGQMIRKLINDKRQSAGIYSINWDAKNEDQIDMSSGLYFLFLQTNEYEKTQKMIILK